MSFYPKGVFALSYILSLALCSNALAIKKHGIDFVVGVDGDFKAAIAKASASGASETNRFIIFFPNGEYELTKLTGDEHGRTTFTPSHVSFIGESIDKTIIWNTSNTEGISTTATLYFPKNTDIYMQDLTIHNKSTFQGDGAARQVAVQQIGDKFIYKNVHLWSGQDTYYTKKNEGSKTYWEGGKITGTVDFICGDGDVFFEGTKLVMDRSGGYITASQSNTEWGYVFNNATIEVSNSSYNGSFYLGRSWARAKTVFLNTKMVAQPKAEGWGPDMNSAPTVFGEYNSKDGNGNTVNTSGRKTRFDGGKDKSTATTLKTVWNEGDAAKYTLANVVGGTDNWAPNKLTKQVEAPSISQNGSNIVWEKDDNVLFWAVFVNGKYHSNTTSNSVDVGTIEAGAKVTVRAANSMGGLGASSNEIAIEEASVNYLGVNLGGGIGGEVKITEGAAEDAKRVAEGTTITISAIPMDGWEFECWHSKDSAKAGSSSSWTTLVGKDNIALTATFKSKLTTFQAESGELENATIESTNTGFKGTGYVNFGATESNLKVPVYVNAAGTYNMTVRYVNGSGSERQLGISTARNSSVDAPILTFEKTADWTTYATKDIEVKLPRGASYIWFTVYRDDGPNIDQLTLSPLHVEKTQDTSSDSKTTATARSLARSATLASIPSREMLFSITGQLIHKSSNAKAVTQGLKPGVYLQYSNTNGRIQKRIIHVR